MALTTEEIKGQIKDAFIAFSELKEPLELLPSEFSQNPDIGLLALADLMDAITSLDNATASLYSIYWRFQEGTIGAEPADGWAGIAKMNTRSGQG